MSARVLTDQEYINLTGKLLESPSVLPDQVVQMKQVHRLLCEGRSAEELTPLEQVYAEAFKGATLAQIPTDNGWEPGVDVTEEPESKPKRSKKD